MEQSRRQFLQASALGAATALSSRGQGLRRILIEADPEPTFRRRLAERELLRGLDRLRLPFELRLAGRDARAAGSDLLVSLRLASDQFKDPEGYSISSEPGRLRISAADEQALLYAVFDFLERQGAFFGIDGESYPLEAALDLILPDVGRPWNAAPRFRTRGLLPWPDFLNCISVFNEEDFRAYFEAMLRMRFNTFGMHVYTGSAQWAESYLSFEFGGVGHLADLDNSASNRWGYLPERTSRYTMGASQFFDGEVFGSDATRLARSPWEIAEKTRQLLHNALLYAHRLGIATGIGFEPYQIPDEIWRALPPEIKPEKLPPRGTLGPRIDMESVTACKLLEARLGQLLETYPEVDHVWLWEDERMNWESQRTGVPLSVTPFRQAHDFLRRNAPRKRLVLAGWGGVVRHFADFHKRLPGDIVFSALNDMAGWDPVHKAFGKLEGRERWAIPWLEDDGSSWQPQFHVNRFEKDMNLAERYGCKGLMGIHWRHRIVDPTAGFQSRFSWEKDLAPAAYYQAYAKTQAAGDRAPALATILGNVDRDHTILSTASNETKDGHMVNHGFSGDWDEAFQYWGKAVPEPGIVASQKQVAAALRRLANSASSTAERERLEYLTKHVELLVPYAESFTLAHNLHLVLQEAKKLKAAGKTAEAGEKVRREGVPLWIRFAPEVRRTMLDFQSIVTTRNDIGTLASMHNKYVRLALVRLRLSMQEFLGELPASIEELYSEMTSPDVQAASRLFVPTRPSLLRKDEQVRIMIVAPGEQTVSSVTLHTRLWGSENWTATPAKLLGRRTYYATLGPFDPSGPLAEYHVSAEIGKTLIAAPSGAPTLSYTVTLA